MKSDLQTKVPLQIFLPEKEFVVLQTSMIAQTREANNAKVAGPERSPLEFDYLNAGDGFVMDIFADVSGRGWYNSIRIAGEIVGATQVPKRVTYDPSSSRVPSLVGISSGLLIAALILNHIFSPFGELFHTPPMVGYWLGVFWTTLLSLVSALLVVVGFWSMFKGERVPSHLLDGDDDSRSPPFPMEWLE